MLRKFYTKVLISFDMTKGLRILAWIHPRSKLIECNLQKGSRQRLYFQSLIFIIILVKRTLSKQR